MNRSHCLRTIRQLAAASLLCLSIMPRLCMAEPPEPPRPEKANRLAELNLAGLHGDRARLPEMLQALSGDIYTTNAYDIQTALLAVARLGATEALPALDEFIRKPQEPGSWGENAKAARARLTVEATLGPISDTASAAERQGAALAKMRGVLAELKLDAAKIKAAIAAYQQDKQRLYFQQWPVEAYALRQLADIAYLNGYKPDKSAEDINALDFSPVPDAALKMRLAPLSRSQRIAWLVEDVSVKHDYSISGPHEAQLLLNEGADAGRAVAVRLQDMSVHPDRYSLGAKTKDRLSPFHAIRDGMTRVLENLGDNSQAPLVVWLLNEQASRDGRPLLTAKQAASISQLEQHKRPIIYGY